MTGLAGRHALVTGGGSGIGAAIAEALHAQGVRLTLVGRREHALREVAERLGDGVAVAVADLAEPQQIEAAFVQARAANGPIGILVNNAGIAPSQRFCDIGTLEWRRVMAVNCDAVFHCCQHALPDLLQQRDGRIVTIASTAGLKGYAYTGAYVASKHAAVGLMRALAVEFAKAGITANAVCPGFTDTAITEHAIERIALRAGHSSADAREALRRFNPQGRLIAPDEVARAVVWLCEPESRAFNGLALPVAGGEI